MRISAWFLGAILGVIGLLSGCAAEPPTRLKPVDEKPVTVSPGPLQRNDGVDTAVGFRNAEALREHYSKHGREFGQITRAEYLFMAQELRDTDADGQKVIVAFRPDGVVTKFDRRDGEFIAYNRNKVIRTFFKPGDGERYFHRQKNRQ